MTPRREVLYRLLPALYQTLDQLGVPDTERGPLQELLSVVGEQVNLLEDDLARWYDNWFIETCEDWVVPYLGDLVGYSSAAPGLATPADPESAISRAVVFPRREVADTIAVRRRKGTLAVLGDLSARIVGWPAHAVEIRHLVAGTAAVNALDRPRSSTADVRRGADLAALGTPFDRLPRTADVRRVNSHGTTGRAGLLGLVLFVYRRQVDSATLVPAGVVGHRNRLTFDVQGIDTQLHTLPQPDGPPGPARLPLPITRRMLRDPGKPRGPGAAADFYGPGKSLFVVVETKETRTIVPADRVVSADLSRWHVDWPRDDHHHPRTDLVAIDPQLGRILFHPHHAPKAVWTTYHYGRAAAVGGGEYERPPAGRPTAVVDAESPGGLAGALCPAASGSVVVEIADSDEHWLPDLVTVGPGQTLEIRAANRCRPVLRAGRPRHDLPHFLFDGSDGSQLVLDGLLFPAGEVRVTGFARVTVRHCTLTPGSARLVVAGSGTEVRVERSIVGGIETDAGDPPAGGDPIRLTLSDSILDNMPPARHCPGEPPDPVVDGADAGAPARLSAARCTVFGQVHVRELGLVENCLFRDPVRATNVLVGCVRFSYVPDGSRVPPPFHGQPALAVERLRERMGPAQVGDAPPPADSPAPPTEPQEKARVAPRFVSERYGHPDYARLADDAAPELSQGADDEGEMGAYHNEFFPQRATHLRTRLPEFIPAGNDIAVIFET